MVRNINRIPALSLCQESWDIRTNMQPACALQVRVETAVVARLISGPLLASRTHPHPRIWFSSLEATGEAVGGWQIKLTPHLLGGPQGFPTAKKAIFLESQRKALDREVRFESEPQASNLPNTQWLEPSAAQKHQKFQGLTPRLWIP